MLASVRHGTYVECFADPARDPVWQTMWANRPTPRDGWFDAGSEAGFGILLDEGTLERYRVG